MSFDLTRVRADFPILQEQIFGQRLVYLDSGASAQKPRAVLDKMEWVHHHGYANVHRGLHTLANRATEAYEDGRKAVQRFLNASRPEEIVFTKGSTEAINLVASSFAAPMIGEGDEIVLTILEHHSNIVPWHFLRERQGAVLKFVDVRDDGSFDLDAFEAALSPRTKMVALTHMSNVTGTIVPIADRPVPMIRSPSQRPATARSSASAGRWLMTTSAVMWPCGLLWDLARGSRNARPVRRQATSSRLSAPRPSMNRAW